MTAIVVLTRLNLTNDTEQRPSLEVKRSSASQEIPGILWNPKVQYRINKSSPTVPILSQIDPVHPPPQFLKISFNIMFLSTFILSNWSLSLRFFYQNPVGTSPSTMPVTCPVCHFFYFIARIFGEGYRA